VTGLAANGCGTIARATTHAIDQLFAHPVGLQEARRLAAKLQDSFDENTWLRLQQIVNESLRFRPTLPLLLRYSPRETIIAKGTDRARVVPAGAKVVAGPIAAMFDPEVFEKPWCFSSDRKLEWYLHFGYGPRVCFGKYVADIVIVETIRSLFLLPNLRRAFGFRGRVRYDGPAVSSLRLRFDTK
jgi:cytochrome P450